ncbi:MAG: type II toxin-antitoxin system RelE/ParE family toxin [Lacipirellulaceae bacterium]
MTVEVRHYVTEDGRDIFGEWLAELRDRRAAARVAVRINRLTFGNFGDCKALRDGVSELRVDFGPGYRVYFGRSGERVVLLLCGGDKRTQSTDIRRAIDYWHDYQARSREP